jgi:hypothetical protein
MGATASFQQILEEKMAAKPEAKPTTPHFQCRQQDPAHLAYLLGNLRVSQWQPPSTKIYPVRPRPAPRPHVLTEDQQMAYDYFNSDLVLGVLLTAAFSRRDLKKAFRALAMKRHPDMNQGAAAPFITLKNNYEILRPLFN